MLNLPKGCRTDFENAITKLNILNVRFHLVMTMFEDGPCDYDVAVLLLSDLEDEYQRIRCEFSVIFDSIEPVKVFGALER